MNAVTPTLTFDPAICEDRRFVCEPYHSGRGRITRIFNCKVYDSWMDPGEKWVTYSIEVETFDHYTYGRLLGSTSVRHDTDKATYQLHGIHAGIILDPTLLLRYVYPCG